jgi:2-polyprenyl-3-methyl-5-hydroxy-6-metoxy-1,4-benzoquinol methylase
MSIAQTSTAAAFDHDRADTFAAELAARLDAGAIAVMISIGHRTGLFDVMSGLPPSSSAVIAARAELAERYVREWLAVMVVAGIVDYEPARRSYVLPEEHAASLTRGGRLGNLAVYAQHVALMGQVQDRVLECFETGAGLRYSEYPCFHALMAEDSQQTVTAQLFDRVLPLVPGLVERLQRGIDVLDAGCGRGSALIAMARRFPRSRFTGYDLCEDAIVQAAATAQALELGNVRFEVRDLSGFDASSCYDLVTSFDAVHDQRSPRALLCSLHAALRPGGTYLMQDVGGSAHLERNRDFPMAAFLYAVSCVHCTPVSLGQGGEGLGTMWGWETAEGMLREAGFASVQRHVLPHDPMNVWFAAHRGAA